MTLDAEASLDEPGVYSAVFVPKDAGAWKLNAQAVTSEGDTLASNEAGYVSEPAISEFRSSGVDTALLRDIAEATGGRVIGVERLDGFVSELRKEPELVQETWTMPLWDQPLVFLIVVCCLIGEWGLRRVRGLP